MHFSTSTQQASSSKRAIRSGCFVLAVLALIWLPMTHAQDNLLKPFYTDGCSVFPDGTWQDGDLWRDCCLKHDYDYWKGGTEEERESSDKALKQCVAKLGEDTVAKLMLAGVRAGGSPYFPTSYRWGYGWPLGRGYKALTEQELQQVEALSQHLPHLFSDD